MYPKALFLLRIFSVQPGFAGLPELFFFSSPAGSCWLKKTGKKKVRKLLGCIFFDSFDNGGIFFTLSLQEALIDFQKFTFDTNKREAKESLNRGKGTKHGKKGFLNKSPTSIQLVGA